MIYFAVTALMQSENWSDNMGNKEKKTVVPAETFIRTWQSANTIDDLAKKLNLQPNNARTRARNYRAKGILLKKFPDGRGAPRLDVDKMKKLAAELAPKAKHA